MLNTYLPHFELDGLFIVSAKEQEENEVKISVSLGTSVFESEREFSVTLLSLGGESGKDITNHK